MTLYDINNAKRMALEMLATNENAELVNEDGEVVNAKDYIATLDGDMHDKIEATILFTKELDAEVEALKKEEKVLKDRRAVKENLIERLRKGVAETMLENDETKFETAKMALSFRKSEAVKINDEFAVPQMYIRRKVTEEPDKTLIKKALKEGKTVDGCELEIKNNLQVR